MRLVKNKRYLVVGEDGFIGKALAGYLGLAGEEVIGTTRREKNMGEAHTYLDLTEEPSSWNLPENISVAFICTGITKIEACQREPKTTSLINATRTPQLVERLAKAGAFVVYLSSNQVFDGAKPDRSINDPYSPVTEYGVQKVAAESQIHRLGKSVSIVRFSKILGPGISLLSDWSESLKNKRTIRPFSNLFMSPIPISCVVSILRLIGDSRAFGIFQASGSCDVSYADVALRFASLLQADPKLVQPIEAEVAGLDKNMIPRHTTLNMDRLKSFFGIEPPDIWWTIKMMCLHPEVISYART